MQLHLQEINDELDSEPNELRRETLRALMIAYDWHWRPKHPWETLEVEKTFVLPIVNPNTGKKSRTFLHGGKIDALARRDGELAVVEHKTCGDTIDDPSSGYWKRLAIDTQIAGYLLAAWTSGHRLLQVLYDVLRKPEIRPRKLPSKEVVQLRVTHTYYGLWLSPPEVEQVVADPEHRESAKMYGARLVHDIKERPDWYFQRRLITLTEKDITAYATELWLDAEDIRLSRTKNDIRRNAQACLNFGCTCEYMDVCSIGDETNLIQIGTLHPELELGEHFEHERILTNSRINTFRTCRRKHHYQYERGLRPQERTEALDFGDLAHRCLAHWWKGFTPEPSEAREELQATA